ncbi:MAG: cupin domain-containing protein [Gammaproteobacteria bacterium]|nr:cupin domain-containing protein [Gammaproteobacteria bacterium]
MIPWINQYDAAREYFFVEGCFINELANDPRDAQLSVARARVEPGRTTRWHKLEGIVERYVVLEGAGRVEVDGMAPTVVQAGDTVTIPAGVPQRIHNCGTGDLVFLALCTPRFMAAAYCDLEDEAGLRSDGGPGGEN